MLWWPFLTQHPLVYADLLKKKIAQHDSKVYLVNTGWIGGSASSGAKRISIQNTRAMITAILDGTIEKSEFKIEPIFNLSYPLYLNDVDSNVLNPREAWNDLHAYDKQAAMLAELFYVNFKTYGSSVSHLEKAGPFSSKELTI